MAIRLFLNVWTEEQQGDILYIKDPIDEALANVSLSAPVESTNYYGRISLNHRPDKLYMVKVMRGNLTNAEWDQINAIPGVRMFPPMPFNTPVENIKPSLKTKLLNVFDAMGIPRTVYNSAPTVGNALRNILAEMNSQEESFGDAELAPDDWA